MLWLQIEEKRDLKRRISWKLKNWWVRHSSRISGSLDSEAARTRNLVFANPGRTIKQFQDSRYLVVGMNKCTPEGLHFQDFPYTSGAKEASLLVESPRFVCALKTPRAHLSIQTPKYVDGLLMWGKHARISHIFCSIGKVTKSFTCNLHTISPPLCCVLAEFRGNSEQFDDLQVDKLNYLSIIDYYSFYHGWSIHLLKALFETLK